MHWTQINQEDPVVFLLGGMLYPAIELLTRGRTHWTMAATGGLALLLLYRHNKTHKNQPLWKKCLVGAGIITGLEFGVGCITNLILDWHVWDYSNCPMNVFGQICLPFSAIWFALCVPGYFLCDRLERGLCKKRKSVFARTT